jgi:hypothetical protein
MKKTLVAILALSTTTIIGQMPKNQKPAFESNHTFMHKQDNMRPESRAPKTNILSQEEWKKSDEAKKAYHHYVMRSKRQKNDEQDSRPMHRKHHYGRTMKKDQK